MVKNLPAMWETWVRSLGWDDPLEKSMATHSGILAWKFPWTEEPGGLQSTAPDSPEGVLARAVVHAVSAVPPVVVYGARPGNRGLSCSGFDTCLPPPTSRLWSSCWPAGSPCSSSWRSPLEFGGLGCQPWACPGWAWWCRGSRQASSQTLCLCRWLSPTTWFQRHPMIHAT